MENTMLRDAICKIEEMAETRIYSSDGHTYCITNSGKIVEIKPNIDVPGGLYLRSLDALVKMVKTEALVRYKAPLYINIPDHQHVKCYAQPDATIREDRLVYYDVEATDVPGWESDKLMDFENAMIALRSRFQHTEDTEYAINLLASIVAGNEMTYSDNGVATTIMMKKGISLQGIENIRPIVSLKPYRTFQEVEQPASEFLIRVSERNIRFIEADGGMWKLEARNTIKRYLEERLGKEVDAGDVVVAL